MEQKLFIAGFIPDPKSEEESGARRIATAFYARDLKHAEAKATFIFVEEYPGAQDAAFKHLICEAAEGIPCPEIDKWDEYFLYENDWPEDVGHPVAPVADAPQPVDFSKLSDTSKIAVLVKYRRMEIDATELAAAIELLQDDAGTFEGHIVEAITKMPSIASMYPKRVIEVIDYVLEKCPPTKKWPEIKAALSTWEKEHIKERSEGLHTDTGATAGGAGASDRGDVKHDWGTLAIEIALGILARSMDFNIYQVPSSIINRARAMVQQHDKTFDAWQHRLSLTPGILDYSRAQLIYAIKTAPEGIENFKSELGDYINRTFIEADHANPDPHMVAVACGEAVKELRENITTNNSAAPDNAPGSDQQQAPEERQGPFYFLAADGEKVGRANKLSGLEKALADSATEISQDEYQARKNGTWQTDNSAAEPQKDTAAEKPEVTNLGGGRFSIDGLVGQQPAKSAPEQVEPQQPSTHAETINTPPAPASDVNYQNVGESLEKELAQKPEAAQDNLMIWRSVMRTDPRYTKSLTGTGFDGTSINAEYMVMRATELFGPIGSRWGFEILEDRMLPGAPLSEAIYEDKKFVSTRILRDADGTMLFEQNHSIKIRLWYQTEADEGSVYAYGATPYIFKTKHGIKCDGEAQKKSLTDAIKKGLSLLGFSADVWLGMYDAPEYVAELHTEFGLKNAINTAEDANRLYNELDEKMTRVANTIENAGSANEAKKVFDTLAREVEIHRKSAEAKGDTERTKYLSSRLRRLAQIKDDRIKSLTAQEQSA